MDTDTSKAQKTFQALGKKYSTPREVQKFLRALAYNREAKGETCRSAWSAWKHRQAHCLEAAFLAAAILETLGFPPLVMSLESQDGLDHVVYVFKSPRGWGAVARSRDEGLHGREPRFKSLRDLAQSFVDPYVDKSGRVEAFGLANLNDTQTNWRASTRNVWKAERYLIDLKHRHLPMSESRYLQLHKRYLTLGPLPQRKGWW